MSTAAPPERHDLRAQIRTRGNWRVVIRPTDYNAGRVEKLGQLEEIARRCSVHLIGWDFPHIGNEAMERGPGWVGLSTDYAEHRETWRLYSSGQFAFLGSLYGDWKERSPWSQVEKGWRPSATMTVYTGIYTYTEIFELAARLAVTPAGGAEMLVDVTLDGLMNRRLVAGSWRRSGFGIDRAAKVAQHRHQRTLSTESLVAAPRDHAMDAAIKLFELFGWDTDRGMMQSFLDELKR